VQLLTITTKIGDSFEGNSESQDDIQGAIVGGIFVEVDKKKTPYLSAIYVDFSKYLSLEELHMSQRKLEDDFFSSRGV
jgi:hypothetical protein